METFQFYYIKDPFSSCADGFSLFQSLITYSEQNFFLLADVVIRCLYILNESVQFYCQILQQKFISMQW
jgi:hypothetical protein